MADGPGQWWFRSTDPNVIDCNDLPCVDVGVGVIHHPYCGMLWDDPDLNAPLTSEEEEMLPPDTAVVA